MSLTTMLRLTASSSLLRRFPASPAALSSRLLFLSSASAPRFQRSLRAAAKRRAAEDAAEGDSAVKLRQGPIVPTRLQSEAKESYMSYAVSALVGRALPDVRDGLKPVHRRILYAMMELGLLFRRSLKKCARVVGEVLGKFHWHGYTAVYETPIRMAQDFSMRYPPINGHGNFGSANTDPPAVMRYTECRLQKYSMLMPLARNEFPACTAIRCKLPPVHNHFRSMMTWVSVDEREVKALELFLSTVKDVTIPANEICRLYVESLSRSSNLATAVYLLSYLHDREIHVPLNTYNILLASVSEASDFQLFYEVFKNLLLSYQPPDFSSYVNVARAIQKVADFDQLLKFIMEVSEMTVHRDPTVMNRIIFVTAKSGQIDKSMMIYEELKNMGRKMDKVTFNTVLAMLGKAGRVDQMLSEFTLMKDLGYIPDIVTYNTLINCLRRLGRLELCKAFTTEMLERGLQMNLRTYTALIDSFGRAGHVKEALRLFDELKSSHRPSVYVYRALISNLKKAGKFDLALKLSEEMNTNASNLTGPSDFKQKKRKRK